MTKKAAAGYGLRSLRSGAAAQAISNLGNQGKGVATQCHYDAVARCLGHVKLTNVIVEAYIGPLNSVLVDTGAVVHMEDEGAAGGVADVESRISLVPNYSRIVVGVGERVLTKVEKACPKVFTGIEMEARKYIEVVEAKKALDKVASKLWCVQHCIGLEERAANREGRPPAVMK